MKGNDQVIKMFNPLIIQCDEHLSNQNGIEADFGQDFVQNRTASYKYHFEKSIEKHLKLLPTEDQQSYKTLVTSLKNTVIEEAFIRVKAQLELLIKRQSDSSAKSLMEILRFWEKVKSRWAKAYKTNFHNAARSNLAEAAQALMKAANETSVSLVDAFYYDITVSALLLAKWENRKNGEINTGRGPTPVELLEWSSTRQTGRAKRYIEENETINESSNSDNASTCNSQPQPQQTSPSQPPKSKRKRSVDSVSFQKILKKAKEIKKTGMHLSNCRKTIIPQKLR